MWTTIHVHFVENHRDLVVAELDTNTENTYSEQNSNIDFITSTKSIPCQCRKTISSSLAVLFPCSEDQLTCTSPIRNEQNMAGLCKCRVTLKRLKTWLSCFRPSFRCPSQKNLLSNTLSLNWTSDFVGFRERDLSFRTVDTYSTHSLS